MEEAEGSSDGMASWGRAAYPGLSPACCEVRSSPMDAGSAGGSLDLSVPTLGAVVFPSMKMFLRWFVGFFAVVNDAATLGFMSSDCLSCQKGTAEPFSGTLLFSDRRQETTYCYKFQEHKTEIQPVFSPSAVYRNTLL